MALALPADGKLHALDLSEEYASIGNILSPVQVGVLSYLHIDAGLATTSCRRQSSVAAAALYDTTIQLHSQPTTICFNVSTQGAVGQYLFPRQEKLEVSEASLLKCAMQDLAGKQGP